MTSVPLPSASVVAVSAASASSAAVRTVRVVREHGGLGDMVTLFPVMDGLRALYPLAKLDFYGASEYRELMLHCAGVDRFIVAPRNKRQRDEPLDERKFSYLRKMIRYDLQYSMWCPAWPHERDTRGDVTRSRVELFCDAAGVPPSPPRYVLRAEELDAARAWLSGFPDPSRVVSLQPHASSRLRDWTDERWAELAALLMAGGWYPVWFDRARRSEGLPGVHVVGERYVTVAARLAVIGRHIGVESGLFHLAAAVGAPTLVLTGCTSGPVVTRFAPTARWISGPVPVVAPPPRDTDPCLSSTSGSVSRPAARAAAVPCLSPCYAFAERGCTKFCRDHGCAVLHNLTARAVYDAFLSIQSTPSTTETPPSYSPYHPSVAYGPEAARG